MLDFIQRHRQAAIIIAVMADLLLIGAAGYGFYRFFVGA